MEAPKKFSIGKTIARAVVAVASFGLFAALSPVFAFNYGVGLFGAGLYNVGELASTATVLSSASANPSSFGDSMTLNATVSPSTATGTIAFKDGSTTVGTATLGHGSGSLTFSSLTAGSHDLIAVYGGNDSFATSTSNTLTWTVTALPSSSSSESTQAEVDTPHGGGRGGAASQAKKVAAAQASILARFQQQLAAAKSSSPSSQPIIVQDSPELAPGEKEHLDRAGRKISERAKAVVESPTSLSSIAERRGLLLASVGTQSVLYRDVPVAAWYAPYVASLVEEGVAQGYKDKDGNLTGEFGVGNPITYAEVLKMAIETAGTKLKGGSPRNVSAQSTWASSYVKAAEDEHFAVFIPTLDVNTPATRGAVIQTILEAMGISTGAKVPSPFTDVSPSNPYGPAITVAAVYGLIEGDTDAEGNLLNRFRPNDPMNRAEVAKIIAIARKVMGAVQ